MKRVALVLALAWSGTSFAGATANAGVVSEYLARGIQSSDGVAMQGGLDWAGASGLYAGSWASNLGGPLAVGDLEFDLYGGWAGALGPATVDVGTVYYSYPDDEQDPDYDYGEAYAELGIGYFSLQLSYSPRLYGAANEAAADLVGKDTDGFYANVVATFPLAETVRLAVQVGHSSGDGVEVAYGERYTDYSVSLSKTFAGEVTVSVGVYDATLKPADDDRKAVAGVKKAFDL